MPSVLRVSRAGVSGTREGAGDTCRQGLYRHQIIKIYTLFQINLVTMNLESAKVTPEEKVDHSFSYLSLYLMSYHELMNY